VHVESASDSRLVKLTRFSHGKFPAWNSKGASIEMVPGDPAPIRWTLAYFAMERQRIRVVEHHIFRLD